MHILSQVEIEAVSGASLASDFGNAVGGAIAGAVDSVQTFFNDIEAGLDAYATRPRVPA